MKKIMFNDRYGLTGAALERRKTMTRRTMKNQSGELAGQVRYTKKGRDLIYVRADFDNGYSEDSAYAIGEIVAVAQSYKDIGMDGTTPLWEKNLSGYYMRTDLSKGWRNKMFVRDDLMPHQIRILDVRAEKMQVITNEDCLREGIIYIEDIDKYYFERSGRDEGFYFNTPREAFTSLIDKINGRGTWESNPYVWVYEFELIK